MNVSDWGRREKTQQDRTEGQIANESRFMAASKVLGEETIAGSAAAQQQQQGQSQ